MTCRETTPELSALLDSTLDSAARAKVSAHLEGCASCRALLADLDRIRSAAQSLGPITPPEHIWLEIAGRIRLEQSEHGAPLPITQRARTHTSSRSDVMQWIGLAAALLLVTAGVYIVARPDASTATPVVIADSNAATTPTVETVEDTLRRAEADYEKAIAQLEQIVKSGDPAVSQAAVATLQRSVTTVDSAIAESRAALTDNPASQPARTSLFDALGTKVSLLQRTVVLMNEMQQNDASAATDPTTGGPLKVS
jgi:anti-sigma factor RsiW